MLLLMQSPPIIGSGGKPDIQPSFVRYDNFDDEDLLILWWALNEL